MNNYILINRTFTEVTPESAEQGGFSDMGFISELEKVSFRELVDMMKEHNESSCSPDNFDTNNWYSTYSFTTDYSTGTERQESIHFCNENSINAAKYWKLARMAANVL